MLHVMATMINCDATPKRYPRHSEWEWRCFASTFAAWRWFKLCMVSSLFEYVTRRASNRSHSCWSLGGSSKIDWKQYNAVKLVCEEPNTICKYNCISRIDQVGWGQVVKAVSVRWKNERGKWGKWKRSLRWFLSSLWTTGLQIYLPLLHLNTQILLLHHLRASSN